MKKGKTVSTKRGRNFNIVLTIVALVLIVAVGGFATYSWVEQATTLDVQMNGTIQRVPGGNNEYHHQVNLSKTAEAPADAISLNDYLDKTSDMVLRPVSSANGKDFFMQTEEKVGENSPSAFTRAGNTSDRNVSYVSFDFDVTSDTDTGIYFDNGLGSDNTPDTENHPRPSFTFEGSPNDELESVKVAIQVNDGTPMIFSQSGEKYNGINNVNGDTVQVTPRKFSECIFGEGNSIFTLKKDTKTKVRITIWLEGTYNNLGAEYQPGKTLNMKLMLTTPWHKSTIVKLIDKTANGMFTSTTGTFSVYNGDDDSEIADMTGSDGVWTANITDSQKNLKFKYVESSTEHTWIASGRGENSCYYIFDCDPTYGVWGTESFGTETIDISQIWIDGTQLTTPTVNGLDSHIKVSTDGEKYYRAAYNTTESKWYVNIDKEYLDKENPKLYIQYYNDDSALTAKWNATEGRENKTTQTTYYLLDTDGNTTDYSTGSWTDTYNIYFYDGTAQQIITDMMKQASEVADSGITFEYIAYPTDTNKETVSGDMIQDEYRFVADKKLKYSDKINRVVFTLSRPTANGDIQKVTYTWDGDGKVNKDIYYTANSYTKDKD